MMQQVICDKQNGKLVKKNKTILTISIIYNLQNLVNKYKFKINYKLRKKIK